MGNYAKTPTVFQMEATECGAASLCMVFAYFGRDVPLEQMRMETGVSRDGCNAGGLMRAAKRHGLACRGCRRSAQSLRDLAPPCILHWDSNHFVVLEGFRGRRAYINDPAAGRRRLSQAELEEGFSGVVLTFSPTASFVREKRKSTVPAFARERLKGQRGALWGQFFTGLPLLLPGIVFPMASRIFIDGVLLSWDVGLLPRLVAVLCVTAVLQAGLTLYRGRVLAKLRKRTVLFCARDFLTALFRLPIRFFDQRYPGDLASRADSCTGAGDFLAGTLPEMLLDALGAAIYLAFLLACSPALTAVAAVFVLAGAAASRVLSAPMADASVRLRQDQGRLAGAVCAGLDLTADMKTSGAEDAYTARVLDCYARASDRERALDGFQGLLEAIPGMAKGLADLAILMAGASLVMGGRMTPGSLAAFLGLFGSFTGPAGKLAGSAKSFQEARADMSRTEDILRYGWDERFDPARPKADMKTKLEGSVELRGVTFGYSPLGDPTVSGIDLRAPCGSAVALAGESGSGKSAVLKVLGGLYRPWSGELLLDGIPAEEVPMAVRSASVAMAERGAVFFPGTVRENLTMWNPHISEEDLVAAARDACIHDVIMGKPGGYGFRLREGASNLSGGQRQRLEIARALATNPSVLLMDEATSALDAIVEKQILDNIRRRGCTCVIAAQRLSALRDCDEILVLEAGRVVERGTHEELMRAGGAYRRLMVE